MRYSNNHLLENLKEFFKKKKGVGKALILLAAFLILFVCWTVGKNHEKRAASSILTAPKSAEEMKQNFGYLSITELDEDISENNAVEVNLNEYKDEYVINKGGDYHLTGELEGVIYIHAKEQNVHLFLDDVSVQSSAGPAIFCEKADKLMITSLDGTENVFSDSGYYSGFEEADACIFSDCDITFNGNGVVRVNGYFKDGVHSKDIVKILNGTDIVKCKRSGIHGNDGVLVADGDLMISSEKYGIKTTKLGPDGRGNLMVSGGNVNIIAGRYAFVTQRANIYIYDCTVSEKSVVDTFDCGGYKYIQEGCLK